MDELLEPAGPALGLPRVREPRAERARDERRDFIFKALPGPVGKRQVIRVLADAQGIGPCRNRREGEQPEKGQYEQARDVFLHVPYVRP